jgi:hypothetical protein
MSYPVVTIFTFSKCASAVRLMEEYQKLKDQVKKINENAQIHVIVYDFNRKKRIFTEKYGYKDLINDKPGPYLKFLTFSPLITVVNSKYLDDGSKYLAYNAIYDSKEQVFTDQKGIDETPMSFHEILYGDRSMINYRDIEWLRKNINLVLES